MKSLKCLLHTAAWLLTSLAALHLGLSALGVNLLHLDQLSPMVAKGLLYAVGASGLVSLYGLVTHVLNHLKGHSSCECN